MEKEEEMKKTLSIAAILFLFLFSGFTEGTQETVDEGDTLIIDPSLSYQQIVRVSNLTDFTLEGENGQKYADVVDVVIDMDRGFVSYLLIEFTNTGEVFDSDDIELNTPYVIPLWYLYPEINGKTMIMDLENKYLYENLPTIPDVTSGVPDETAEWDTRFLSTWSNPVTTIPITMRDRYERIKYYQYTSNVGGGASAITNIRYSELRDVNIKDQNRKNMGNIKDFTASLATGEILTAVFNPAGDEQFSNYPLPLNVFVLSGDPAGIYIASNLISIDEIEGFGDKWPDFKDKSWYREINQPWREYMLHSSKINRGMRGIPRPNYPLEHFIGFSLLNYFNEGLGDIKDFIVCRNGNITYAVVDYNEIFNLGGKNTLVPIRLLDFYPSETVAQVNMIADDLNGLPYFEDGAMPDTSIENWDKKYKQAWQDLLQEGEVESKGQSQPTITQPSTPKGILATDMLGYDVENPEGQDVGAIDDIILDLITLNANYVVLAVNGIGSKLLAVPHDSLAWDLEEERLVFDVTASQIEEAPGFDWNDVWPQEANTRWQTEADKYWMEK
jgi:sporulation protein YlmC with PRC-barrel domain